MTRQLALDWLDTPLGLMVAVGDERSLHALEYAEQSRERSIIDRLSESLQAVILPGKSAATGRMAGELASYFHGEQVPFTVPLVRGGSSFQNAVWDALLEIPVGEVRSYADIARRIDQMPALRAVAQAIGDNPFAVVIPCHRVINTGGKLGGYGGGLPRKRWLLEHEQRMIRSAEKFELT